MNPVDLLNDNNILVISVPLAEALGVPKSIILRRIAMWCGVNQRDKKQKEATHFHFGIWWMYNTLEDWVEDIPIYGERTLQQNLRELEDLRLVLSTNKFNKWALDKTKWYAVNETAFIAFVELWEKCGKPIRNGGGKASPEYINFELEWEKIKESYPVLENMSEDESDASSKTNQMRHLHDESDASAIPDNTEGTQFSPPKIIPFGGSGNRYANAAHLAQTSALNAGVVVVGGDEDESTLPQYIQGLLATCKCKWKNVSQSMRDKIHGGIRRWDEEKRQYVFDKSIVQIYDEDALFARWINEVIIPELRAQFPGNISRGQFISRTQNYSRFEKFLKTEDGKRFAIGQQVQVTIAPQDVADASLLDEMDG